jgi:hypothetical protein
MPCKLTLTQPLAGPGWIVLLMAVSTATNLQLLQLPSLLLSLLLQLLWVHALLAGCCEHRRRWVKLI